MEGVGGWRNRERLLYIFYMKSSYSKEIIENSIKIVFYANSNRNKKNKQTIRLPIEPIMGFVTHNNKT